MSKKVVGLYLLLVMFLVSAFIFPVRLSRRSNALLGYSIVIDPGHGGRDDGTSYQGVREDEVNLAIATKLFDLCVAQGAIAYITRIGDYDLASLYASNRKREDLAKRVEIINRSGATFFISIHMNAYAQEAVHGPMLYCRENDEESHRLATAIQTVLAQKLQSDKPIHEEDFYLFRKTYIPGVLVECGFLSNTEERQKLIDPKYQAQFASYLYAGVLAYQQGGYLT